jgi:thioester reductase-like protein
MILLMGTMNKFEKTLEEKRLLLTFLKEENEGDKDLTMIDYELIQGSLNVMKTFSLIPQSKRGRKMMLADHIDNLLDLAMAKTKALGYIMPIELNLSDIDRIIYTFDFKYSKYKGKENNKRIHVDSYSTTALDEDSAINALKERLKKLKESLVEVKSVKKKHSLYILKNGEQVNAEYVVKVA